MTYERKGLVSEAIEEYKRVREDDPRSAQACFNLGLLYEKFGCLEEAAKAYQKAVRSDGSFSQAHFHLANLHFKVGEHLPAFNKYRKALDIDPQNEAARLKLGELSQIYPQLAKEWEEKREAKRRLTKSKIVETLPGAGLLPKIRVGLSREREILKFKCGGPFLIKDKVRGSTLLKGGAEEVWQVAIAERKDQEFQIVDLQDKKRIVFKGPIIIIPIDPSNTITIYDKEYGRGYFWAGVEDREYRGEIEILPSLEGTFSLVNIVNLEEYLYGVIPAEMPADWSFQALKAQAVAARSEALAKLGKRRHQGFDLCDDVHCAVYNGVRSERPSTSQAVDETRGWVLTSAGKVIDAVYSNNCGGHTEDAQEVWRTEEIPYLKGVFDALLSSPDKEEVFPLSPQGLERWLKDKPKVFCNNQRAFPGSFRWYKTLGRIELEGIVNRKFEVGTILKILPGPRGRSGYLKMVTIFGSKGVLEVKSDYLRSTLGGLRSNLFKIETTYDPQGFPLSFTFFGGGWGHNVGMCQAGVSGMAEEGYSYEQILKHYFRETVLTKIY